MRKKLLVTILTIVSLVGCGNNDKTVVLSEDTSKDTGQNYSVNFTELTFNHNSNDRFIPGYYYKDRIYGLLATSRDESFNYNKGIKASYFKDDKVLKTFGGQLNDMDINIHKEPFSKVYIEDYRATESGETTLCNNIDNSRVKLEKGEHLNMIEGFSYNESRGFVSGNKEYYYIAENSFNGNGENYESLLSIYSLKSQEKVTLKTSAKDNNIVEIDDVMYSSYLKSFLGINRNGEIFKLNLENNTISAETLINLSLDMNFTLYKDSNRFNYNTICGNKLVFYTHNESGYKGSYLDLKDLKVYDFDYKLNRDTASYFMLDSGFMLINVENLDESKNDYVLLDMNNEKIEVVTNFSIDKMQYIETAISDDSGKYVTVSIVSQNANNNEQKLLELTIDKLV